MIMKMTGMLIVDIQSGLEIFQEMDMEMEYYEVNKNYPQIDPFVFSIEKVAGGSE